MAVASLNTAFDLKDIFKQVHGYVPAHIDSLPNSISLGQSNAQITPVTKKTTNLYGQPLWGSSDLLGHEVFCPVTIEVDGKDYVFPFAVIGISRTKTVVMTEMSELNGSVKEVIGNKDYDITIKGFVIGDYDQFPDDKLKMLNDIFEQNQTVRLKSAFSDIFLHKNDKVLILKMDIPEKPKVIGVRDFALQMVSDGVFNLYVNE